MSTPVQESRTADMRKVVGAIVGLVALVTLMLLAIGAPAVHSGPHELPVAISGPSAAVDAVSAALEGQDPDAFELTTHDSADDVETAIRDRDAVGGIAIGPEGTTVYTASGAGTPIPRSSPRWPAP